MFFSILLTLVSSIKKICVCYDECHPGCQTNIFNISSKGLHFKDFFQSKFNNVTEIVINFYSRQQKFQFNFDSSLFDAKFVTMATLSESQPVKIQIKKKYQLFAKEILLKPNYKVNFPELIPYLSSNINQKKNILSDPNSTPVPVSIGITQMTVDAFSQTDIECRFTDHYNANNGTVINYNSGIKPQNVGCDPSKSTTCGLKCTAIKSNFSYTFKGVRFEIYGTFDSDHHRFDIELDGSYLATVDENSQDFRACVSVYLSDLLEYKEHKVKIVAKSEKYAIYKIAFWPSMKAKRLNPDDFTKSSGSWTRESDGVGGYSVYKSGGPYARVSIYASRFWVYGVRDFHLSEAKIQYTKVESTFQQLSQGQKRKECVLLHESGDLTYFENTITLSTTPTRTLYVYCIYYEEPPIPLSVNVGQMTPSGGFPTCTSYKSSTEIGFPSSYPAQGVGCSISDLSHEDAYHCGLICKTEENFSYTFRGVKFAVYANCYENIIAKFFIYLDQTELSIIDLKSNGGLYKHVFESHVFNYGTHTVTFRKREGRYSLYKLVFWPSLKAKRINSTEFIRHDTWHEPESDGNGGIRHYKENGGTASINLSCKKFWFYGITADGDAYKPITFQYNGIKREVIQRYPRNELVLLHESDELDINSMILNISTAGVLMISSLYCEEQPSITPIPISVGLYQMQNVGTNQCSNNHNKDDLTYESGLSEYGCITNNLNTADAYQCGLRCWGSSMTFSYTFKGVKFALYGKFDINFNNPTIIELDGKQIAEVSQLGRVNKYALLYESGTYVYKDHTVNIHSKNEGLYEIYKLVYWPSMRAKRINSTQFVKSNNWTPETDGIGGVREYTKDVSGTFYRDISTSRIWIYSSTDENAKGMHVSYDKVVDKFLNQISATRIDGALIEDSKSFGHIYTRLSGKTNGDSVLYCVYYHDEPSPFEYVDKTFHTTLPYIDIFIGQKSNINQISGCKFIDIAEEHDYFIKLEKSVSFFDNTFQYDNINNETPSPIRIQYSGTITIKNCIFKCSGNRRAIRGNIFFSGGNYVINANFESCQFVNCWRMQSEAIISIQNKESSISLNKCKFSYSQPGSSDKVVNAKCCNAIINECNFINTGSIFIMHYSVPSQSKALLSSNLMSINKCVFDSCSQADQRDVSCIEFLETATFSFESNVIKNIKGYVDGYCFVKIDSNFHINEIIFRNISLINNQCYSLYGGGSGIQLIDTLNLLFIDCNFSNNEARQSSIDRYLGMDPKFDHPYYNGDGGGIQIGFYCQMSKASVKFEKCTFKHNLAHRHGGAIALQTLGTVEITDCTFESNEANHQFESSSELLFESHYHKKNEGRGGAIYINPTYTYSLYGCNNTDSFMTDVKIKRSTFTKNSAQDGYAMYIEGDDAGTTFELSENNFNDNYNYGESVNSDPNITIRGIIATEIHSFPKNTVNTNSFSNVDQNQRPKKLVFVDHYGKRIGTDMFTESDVFSFTQDFSKSDLFSPSVQYTKSDLFSNSEYFSFSKGFTESNDFSESRKFSASSLFKKSDSFSSSDYFSQSIQFSHTYDFSESDKFSKSTIFTESYEFSKSDAFSESEKFSDSDLYEFRISEAFTKSEKFTFSKAFSESEDFSYSEAFSNSKAFSKSENFQPSALFSKTKDFSNSEEFSRSNEFSELSEISSGIDEISSEDAESSNENDETSSENAESSSEDAESSSEDDETSNENDEISSEDAESSSENDETSSENAESSSEDDETSSENAESSSEDAESSSENDETSSENAESSSEDDEISSGNAESSSEDVESSSENDETSNENDEISSENAESSSEDDETSSENAESSSEDAESSSENDETSSENAESSSENDETSSENEYASSENKDITSGNDQTPSRNEDSTSGNKPPISSETLSIIKTHSAPDAFSSIVIDKDPEAPGSSKKSKSFPIGLLIGLIVGILALLIIIVLIIIFILRRKKKNLSEDSNNSSMEVGQQANSTSGVNQEFDNPLYNDKLVDKDPFLDNFEESF